MERAASRTLSDPSALQGSGSVVQRIRKWLGPRPGLVLGFAALLVVILVGFAYVVVDSQAKASDSRERSREEAVARFDVRAGILADLTAAIFTASTAQAGEAAAKAFGGPSVDDKAVSSLAERSRLAYALILDRDGKPIAASATAPAAVRTRSPNASRHLREALAGRVAFSDVVSLRAGKRAVIEFALPFETRFGRRVQVQAFDANVLGQFFRGYLIRPQEDDTYIVDSRNQVVAASTTDRAGTRPSSPGLLKALDAGTSGTYSGDGVERYFTSAAVRGTSWHVVLSARTKRLLPELEGARESILVAVLIAFALAGAVSLFFLRRALAADAQLAATNRELTAVNATLEERVAERTAAAEERSRDLARSNAELEQFASIASHDLQEPLRKIRMFGDRLRTQLDDLAAEPAADLERMHGAAERMQRLIDDLLTFSRVGSRGRGFEPVNLAEVTGEVLSDLEARMVELNARVDVSDLPVIEADRSQMRQMLQNLVSNALKFHREGEAPFIRIRGDVVTGDPPRFPGEATGGDRCVITVEDNGIGFDEKYAERIFAAFERLHSRTAYDGTGIGLSIARKIAWRHGGTITVKSAPERGSTFSVTLPVTHDHGHNESEKAARHEQ
jgi:signal transduction histidine kinase